MSRTTFRWTRGVRFVDAVRAALDSDDRDVARTVLDAALRRLREGYVALETVDRRAGTRVVSALVARRLAHPRGEPPLFVLIPESDSPSETRCPARILALLTPTEDKSALAWRQACRDWLSRDARVWARLRPGVRVRFERGIRVANSTLNGGVVTSVSDRWVQVDSIYRLSRETALQHGVRFAEKEVWHGLVETSQER